VTGALLLRGDAARLPLADETVDLIVTSPPYWQLRAYATGHPAEVGGEPTARAYLEALWAVTGELARVLKPTGSLFVNLGDRYSTGNSGASGLAQASTRLAGGGHRDAMAEQPSRRAPGFGPKSLLGLPWAYALGCTGLLTQLGGPEPGPELILRAELVWAKPNALPESVLDRVRRTHETWFHFTRSPRYYAAVDELRHPYAAGSSERAAAGYRDRRLQAGAGAGQRRPAELASGYEVNPAGALPGSVWPIPSQPLQVPDWLGVDHYAAFPAEWPRRLILGWSPPAICLECGEGRRPVTRLAALQDRRGRVQGREGDSLAAAHGPDGRAGERYRAAVQIAGYVCACTPHTEHPERRQPTSTPREEGLRLAMPATGSQHRWPEHHPARLWQLAGWQPPPTRPAVVLDPFGGTGTTVMVARALGRLGVDIDLSAAYCRLAAWRVLHSGHAAGAQARTNQERQGRLEGLEELNGDLEVGGVGG
jgi:SAM-dependent methyltransferase